MPNRMVIETSDGKWFTPEIAPSCPVCGEHMNYKTGPYGDFWGCSKFPSCKGKRQLKDTPQLDSKLAPSEEEIQQMIRDIYGRD